MSFRDFRGTSLSQLSDLRDDSDVASSDDDVSADDVIKSADEVITSAPASAK
jgi:hypothetical protein